MIFSCSCRDWKAPRLSPGCRDRILRYTLCLWSRLPGLEGPQIQSRLPGPDTGRKCKTVSYYLKYPLLHTQYHIVDGNTTCILEKLNSINDVGVIFDSNLTFKDHMAQKINKAYTRTVVSWVTLKEILYTWTV